MSSDLKSVSIRVQIPAGPPSFSSSTKRKTLRVNIIIKSKMVARVRIQDGGLNSKWRIQGRILGVRVHMLINLGLAPTCSKMAVRVDMQIWLLRPIVLIPLFSVAMFLCGRVVPSSPGYYFYVLCSVLSSMLR